MQSLLILGSDTRPFLLWWAASILLGLGFYPLGAVLFRRFDDRGWLFSRALGIGAGGYLVFVLCRLELLSFTGGTCIGITAAAAVFAWILFIRFGSEDTKQLPDWKLLLAEEILFFLAFLLWTWCAGFHPAASGTEKPMDYGFMKAMMQSEAVPARDIWYSQGTINYYYGGQFYGVYLTKLTFTRVNETYHLMMALVAAFCSTLSFSIVRQALKDRGIAASVCAAGGLFAGAAVSFAGNVHYLLYGLLGSVFQLSGWEDYWFPSSTRYIGHNPLTEDQCIHEFPSYSFVLGDLHAHVINLFLVLSFIGLMYAWFQRADEEENSLKSLWRQPHVLAAGILTGVFKWTNYWDFIIYFTVFLFTAACLAFRKRQPGSRRWILQIPAAALLALLVQTAAAWPFTSQFDTMFQGVAPALHHTPLYQLAVLWGVPVVTAVLFAAAVIRRKIHRTDLFFVMLSVCALGLILIPELVYVRDIYENGYARSNTMFKLTYQAYVLFALLMSYAFFRIFALGEAGSISRKPSVRLLIKLPSALCAGIIFLTFGYGGYAVNCWFGNILDPSGYEGLDAEAFLESAYPEDAAAIRFLEETVSGQQVVLEAAGDSYSSSCRVSAMTGLPTLEGWYVHEWLWRNDPEDLNNIKADIDFIYTGQDRETVLELLDQYEVSYVFIGSCEREAYGENLNEELLRSLGTAVFDGQEAGIENGAVIIQIGSSAAVSV